MLNFRKFDKKMHQLKTKESIYSQKRRIAITIKTFISPPKFSSKAVLANLIPRVVEDFVFSTAVSVRLCQEWTIIANKIAKKIKITQEYICSDWRTSQKANIHDPVHSWFGHLTVDREPHWHPLNKAQKTNLTCSRVDDKQKLKDYLGSIWVDMITKDATYSIQLKPCYKTRH